MTYEAKNIVVLFILILSVSCLEGYESNIGATGLPSSDEFDESENKTPTNEERIKYVTKQVSVGVGRGGGIVTSYDGFKTLVHSEQVLVPGESYTDAYLENECRFGSYKPYAPDHDPHMFRGIAYGNDKFVAVGGCCHAISRTSSDGVNWNPEVKVNKETVTYGGCPWAGDVAFGNGVFAALGGGVSMWSEDGENWQRITWENGIPPGNYRRVDFANGVFIAVGGTYLALSTDGKNWTTDINIKTTNELAGGLDLILLKNSENTRNLHIYNTNTSSWVVGHTFDDGISAISFSDVLKKFFVKAGGNIYESEDGYSWTWFGWSSQYFVQGYSNGNYYSFRRSWGVDASSSRYTTTDGSDWSQAGYMRFNPIIDFMTAEVKVEAASN